MEIVGHGLVSISGVVHSCQLVEANELKNWRTQAVADNHGSKILVGGPPLSLHIYFRDSKEAEREAWHFDGS